MVQSAGEPLLARLRGDARYGGAWYSHAPCYRLIVAFTDGLPRQWVVDAADPRLRPYLYFSKTNFTEAERTAARLEMGLAIKAAGVTEAVFVDHGANPERLEIGVSTEADAAKVRATIPPQYRPLIHVWVGDIYPRPER